MKGQWLQIAQCVRFDRALTSLPPWARLRTKKRAKSIGAWQHMTDI